MQRDSRTSLPPTQRSIQTGAGHQRDPTLNNATVFGFLDSFAPVDLALSYDRGDYRHGLDVDNLFDTDYEAAVRNQSIIVPGMGGT